VKLGDGASQALSPDGQWAAAIRPDINQIILLPTGAGDARVLPRGSLKSLHAPVRWLPDNRRILFMGSEAGPEDDGIYLQDTNQGDPKRISPKGDWTLSMAVPPDGRSFTALRGPSMDTLTAEVAPLDGGAPVPIPGLEPGDIPLVWSTDGRFLYVWKAAAFTAEVYKLDTTTHNKALWKTLAPADRAGLTQIGLVLPTPDGKYYVYDYVRSLGELYSVTGIR